MSEPPVTIRAAIARMISRLDGDDLFLFFLVLAMCGAAVCALAIAVQILIVDRRARDRFAAAVDSGPVTQEIPAVPAAEPVDLCAATATALLTPDAPIPGRYTPGRPLTDWEAAEWAWMSRALAATKQGDQRGRC